MVIHLCHLYESRLDRVEVRVAGVLIVHARLHVERSDRFRRVANDEAVGDAIGSTACRKEKVAEVGETRGVAVVETPSELVDSLLRDNPVIPFQPIHSPIASRRSRQCGRK